MATYVYGVVEPGADAPSGRGIDDASLGLVAGHGVAAIVSEVPDQAVRLGRDAMLVHARVLERALDQGTVLPMRFGVVMSGSDDVRERLLRDHAAVLQSRLLEFAGKVEIRIRGVYDETRLMRTIVRDNPEIATLNRTVRAGHPDATYYERIRLGELVAAAVERRREHDARIITEALAEHALDVDVGQPMHERVVVNASFLLARSALEPFDKTLDRTAADYEGAIRFKYTGPLPPHSFVSFAEAV